MLKQIETLYIKLEHNVKKKIILIFSALDINQ